MEKTGKKKKELKGLFVDLTEIEYLRAKNII